ncbi:MAG TPA: hypothetical protein VG244_15330 [Acidimicrobiales bacterium]|nr:hypothetical protein [Acidimicrobiales bacterium]
MDIDVIGSRYRLGSVVTCTPESTTWQARDTWLDERVLVVLPEPGFEGHFAALAGALMDRASAHFVDVYDAGTALDDFVVVGVPTATFSDVRAPREEEDVLVAGQALGDALEALHERGVVHGDLHPGSITVAESGEAALSPWPLAHRPQNWSGPGGFGSDPDLGRNAAAEDDVRALGAVLLAALAGPPVLSSAQIENLERELAGRAPSAVAIADRALTPPARGGYHEVAELRDDCAAALSGHLVAAGAAPDLAPSPLVRGAGAGAAVARRDTELSEGRRAAVVVAVAGAAVLAGLGLSGALGASARLNVHPVTAHASGGSRPTAPAAVATASPSRPTAPARLADHPASALSSVASAAHGVSAPGAAPTPTTAPRPPATTTTAPPSTTTSSPPTTPTTTTSSTTTSTSSTTTTTEPASTTTSLPASGGTSLVQAGPDAHWYGSGDFGQLGGR